MMMMMMSLFLQRCHPRLCDHPCSQRLCEVRRSHSNVMFVMKISRHVKPLDTPPHGLCCSHLNVTRVFVIEFNSVNTKRKLKSRQEEILVCGRKPMLKLRLGLFK